MSRVKLYRGDCLDVMKRLPEKSVHCCISSPPYFGLRDYGTAAWKGGDPGCDHRKAVVESTEHIKQAGYKDAFRNGNGRSNHAEEPSYRDLCRKCGARRVDRQIGLEPTPDAFVACMVRVFREVYRVLRDDGVCWLNLGDSYVANGRGWGGGDNKGNPGGFYETANDPRRIPGLKTKDLIGIPWRVALALQADGWYLRSDIVWAKPNPMPESVRDRPTKSHEYVFLLTKRPRYFFDREAVREARSPASESRYRYAFSGTPGADSVNDRRTVPEGMREIDPAGRNIRSVWTITPKPFKGAHFATFPPALVERCVKAGTSERGCCPACGGPWERVTETTYERAGTGTSGRAKSALEPFGRLNGTGMAGKPTLRRIDNTLGWRPTCECFGALVKHEPDPEDTYGRPWIEYVPEGPQPDPIPCTVLDPFAGAGTVGLVCDALGRDHVGIDLNPEYVAMARRRIAAARRRCKTTTPANA